MFHVSARAKYDAALCMYHDQALIPIKALHFEDAVNVTLGIANRPHGSRPWHGVRYCRPGPCRPAADGGGDPHGGGKRSTARRSPLDRARPNRCARSSRGTASARARRSARISSSTASCWRGSPPFRALSKGERVYEVGPGPGGLTRGCSMPAPRCGGRARPPLHPGSRRARRDFGTRSGHRGRRARRSMSASRRRRRACRRQPALQCRNRAAAQVARWRGWPPWWQSLT